MTDLAKHQPLYYKKSKIMQAIDGALDTEFDRLKAAAADISLESNIQTTNDWISVWESSVGLSHNTLRGAAGGAVLIAELLCAQGYIPKK